MPPEVWFKVRWPDETADVCYSPSTVIKDVFVAGHAYTLTDFVARSEEGLRQASARVKHVRGYACPKAGDQLMRIKETAAAFEHLTAPMVIVESFEASRLASRLRNRPMVFAGRFENPYTDDQSPLTYVPVIIVGGGQAGLSASLYLKRQGIEHLVLEKNSIGYSWREERWDSFCLVTPNWQCQLPEFPYSGDDPDGFMVKAQIVKYIKDFAAYVDPPIKEGVTVTALGHTDDGGFFVVTTDGRYTADKVILAVSGYHKPSIPRVGERLPKRLSQIHSQQYRSPDQVGDGAVLIVGTGQSGCQIAEDFHRVGRQVHLAVGSAPRSPRKYRGRDTLDWLHEMGQYDITVDDHPLGEKVRLKQNHYFSGRDGGLEIDLRKFALEGLNLHGRLSAIDGERVTFGEDLAENLDSADAAYLKICRQIDDYILRAGKIAPTSVGYEAVWTPPVSQDFLELDTADVKTVIWCTGFRPDWSWIDLPAFNGEGYPTHRRGVCTVEGLYVVGLPWLTTWGSGRFSGVARDAAFIVDHLAVRLLSSPPLVRTGGSAGWPRDRQTAL